MSDTSSMDSYEWINFPSSQSQDEMGSIIIIDNPVGSEKEANETIGISAPEDESLSICTSENCIDVISPRKKSKKVGTFSKKCSQESAFKFSSSKDQNCSTSLPISLVDDPKVSTKETEETVSKIALKDEIHSVCVLENCNKMAKPRTEYKKGIAFFEKCSKGNGSKCSPSKDQNCATNWLIRLEEDPKMSAKETEETVGKIALKDVPDNNIKIAKSRKKSKKDIKIVEKCSKGHSSKCSPGKDQNCATSWPIKMNDGRKKRSHSKSETDSKKYVFEKPKETCSRFKPNEEIDISSLFTTQDLTSFEKENSIIEGPIELHSKFAAFKQNNESNSMQKLKKRRLQKKPLIKEKKASLKLKDTTKKGLNVSVANTTKVTRSKLFTGIVLSYAVLQYFVILFSLYYCSQKFLFATPIDRSIRSEGFKTSNVYKEKMQNSLPKIQGYGEINVTKIIEEKMGSVINSIHKDYAKSTEKLSLKFSKQNKLHQQAYHKTLEHIKALDKKGFNAVMAIESQASQLGELKTNFTHLQMSNAQLKGLLKNMVESHEKEIKFWKQKAYYQQRFNSKKTLEQESTVNLLMKKFDVLQSNNEGLKKTLESMQKPQMENKRINVSIQVASKRNKKCRLMLSKTLEEEQDSFKSTNKSPTMPLEKCVAPKEGIIGNFYRSLKNFSADIFKKDQPKTLTTIKFNLPVELYNAIMHIVNKSKNETKPQVPKAMPSCENSEKFSEKSFYDIMKTAEKGYYKIGEQTSAKKIMLNKLAQKVKLSEKLTAAMMLTIVSMILIIVAV